MGQAIVDSSERRQPHSSVKTLLLRSALLLATVALLLTGAAGCKKSAAKKGSTTFTLKGATEVVAALDRRDYDGAVVALVEVKAGVSAEKDRAEYRELLQKVKDSMVSAMSTNEAAIKAYQALRFVEAGR